MQNNNSTRSNILHSAITASLSATKQLFTHMESAIFFSNWKLGVVEFVRVSELYLPLPTYVERKTRLGKSYFTSFKAQWNAAIIPLSHVH